MTRFSHTGRELLASFVVFLVALPLCMGIAIASGVDPAVGLVTGIVGGLLVGFLAGSPLQVSGPAAGLVVICYDIVQAYGIVGLGAAGMVAGGVQLLAGAVGFGRWFRAVAPAVIYGMLAGIGVLIFASQFHVMLDHKPHSEGLTNLLTIPSALLGLLPLGGSQHSWAGSIGVLTIAGILGWEWLRPKSLSVVPGALVGVGVATVAANVVGLDIRFIAVPESLGEAMTLPSAATLAVLAEPRFWGAALGLAAVASAESLLCATAVDKLHAGVRTDYDRELRAQGIGNIVCGVLGALPLTGVIVRSSANVAAGATTRYSAVLHGVWLLALAVAAPSLLALVPTAALAGVLVHIGFKLVSPHTLTALGRFGKGQVAIYFVTVVAIVTTDLLTGVVLGVVLSVAHALYKTMQLTVVLDEQPGHLVIRAAGKGSFLTLPQLAAAIEGQATAPNVTLDLSGLQYVDHAVEDLVLAWRTQRDRLGLKTVVYRGPTSAPTDVGQVAAAS